MNIERAVSRRDLFRHGAEVFSPPQQVSPHLEHALVVPLSRRDFTRLSAAAVMTLADSQSREVYAAKENTDQPETGASQEKEPTLLDTIKEIALLNAGNTVAVVTLDKLGVPVGNANVEQLVKRDKQDHRHEAYERLKLHEKAFALAGSFTYICGLKPLEEEFEFRFIPSFLLSRIAGKGTHWKFGVPVSVAFALWHNLVRDEYGDYTFHKKIPLAQFTMGLYFWKAMRERGFWHAATAHGTANAEAITISMLAKGTRKLIGKE